MNIASVWNGGRFSAGFKSRQGTSNSDDYTSLVLPPPPQQGGCVWGEAELLIRAFQNVNKADTQVTEKFKKHMPSGRERMKIHFLVALDLRVFTEVYSHS